MGSFSEEDLSKISPYGTFFDDEAALGTFSIN